MKNCAYKVASILLILIVAMLSFVTYKQNKEISRRNQEIIEKNQEITEYKNKYAKQSDEISELKKDLKEWKKKKDYYYEISEAMQQCEKYRNYSINSMFYCTDEAAAKWEKVLNKNLAESKKVLTPVQYQLLLVSQNRWQEYKKAEIQFLKSTFGSSMGVFYQNQVNIHNAIMNEEKARDLDFVVSSAKDGAFIQP